MIFILLLKQLLFFYPLSCRLSSEIIQHLLSQPAISLCKLLLQLLLNSDELLYRLEQVDSNTQKVLRHELLVNRLLLSFCRWETEFAVH